MLRRNVIAGVANSAWTTIVGIAVVPLYLRYLGVEAYGVIGFFTTTQALMQVLDLGLAPTLSREVARYSGSGQIVRAARLLHTLATIYWIIAFIAGAALAGFAPLIAASWLRSHDLSQHTTTIAVALMGVVLACRWPASLYLGALIGAERLVTASTIAIVTTSIASLGAVVVLATISPTLEAFFAWHALVGLLHALAMRAAAWRAIGRTTSFGLDLGELKRVWRFSAAMGGITVYAVVFTQLDKVLLSRMLPLGDFGRYMLATTVASALYVLITPIYNAIYPRFAALVAAGDVVPLTTLYRSATRLLGSAVFPTAMLLLLCGGDLVRIWTGNGELAASVAPIIAILAAGSALHGVMYVPFALQLAYGLTRLPIAINTVLVIILVPLLLVLTGAFGAIGGATAWLVLHFCYVVLGTWMTHRHVMHGLGWKWVIIDVGVPLIFSVFMGLLGSWALAALPPLGRVGGGGGLALLAFVVTVMALPDLRGGALEAWASLRRRTAPSRSS